MSPTFFPGQVNDGTQGRHHVAEDAVSAQRGLVCIQGSLHTAAKARRQTATNTKVSFLEGEIGGKVANIIT